MTIVNWERVGGCINGVLAERYIVAPSGFIRYLKCGCGRMQANSVCNSDKGAAVEIVYRF